VCVSTRRELSKSRVDRETSHEPKKRETIKDFFWGGRVEKNYPFYRSRNVRPILHKSITTEGAG